MSFFDDIGKKISELVSSTAKKSEDIIDIIKINHSINNEKDNIDKLFIEIGKICYDLYSQESLHHKGLKDLCSKVKEHKEKIMLLKSKITEIKEKSKDTDETRRGTDEAGQDETQQNEPEAEQDNASEQGSPEDENSEKCPNCNASISEGSVFCSNCGTKL